jgi:DDE superfamily endonuclease
MRRRWRRNQRKLDPRRLVFIDETALSTSMTRRGGRAARGQRLVCKVPFGSWQSVTMVAALRHDRMTAPMTLNGAMTGDSFRSYIAQVLGPTLRRGDIIVMDNVPLHLTQGSTPGVGEAGRVGADVPRLQSGPQSDRAGNRQVEGTPTQTGTALATAFGGGSSRWPATVHARRVRRLPASCRIWSI